MTYGVAGYLYYFAFDKTTGLGVAGDSANHTLRLQKDGGSSVAPSNSPATADATYGAGWYKVLLTATETAAGLLFLCGTSSTTNILIEPKTQITTDPMVRAYCAGNMTWNNETNAGSYKLPDGTTVAFTDARTQVGDVVTRTVT